MSRHPLFFIDLSGKVLNYDNSLYRAIVESTDADITFIAPHSHDVGRYTGRKLHLVNLIPKRLKISNVWWKRVVKALEGVINYHVLLFYILKDKPALLHFQWFPFIEICSVDIFYIALFRFCRLSPKIVLTIHNVYPHDMTIARKESYNRRFRKMDKYIDRYIVHTKSTLQEVEQEFGIRPDRMSVVPHGIFTPQYTKKQQAASRYGKSVILYGGITPYKGADILLDAIQLLSPSQREHLHVTIAGSVSEDYLQELQNKAEGCKVDFLPYYVPNDDLYGLIAQSDYIALPYRNISQSGVLLLALYFRKPLLVSDLPSFKETLEGFTDDMFFEAGNPQALANLIIRHLNNDVDTETQMKTIEHLNTIYSWEEAARMTYSAYKNCL